MGTNVKKQLEQYLKDFPKHPDTVEITHLNGKPKENLSIDETIKKYGDNLFIASSTSTTVGKPGETSLLAFIIIEKRD